VIEVDAIVAHPELVQHMTLRGEVLPVGRAARVPDQDPGRRGSRGLMSVLKSLIVPPASERIAMAAGSRLMAHETPRSTSTTRETGLHDAIDQTLDQNPRERTALGVYQHVTLSDRAYRRPGSRETPPLRDAGAPRRSDEAAACPQMQQRREWCNSIRRALSTSRLRESPTQRLTLSVVVPNGRSRCFSPRRGRGRRGSR